MKKKILLIIIFLIATIIPITTIHAEKTIGQLETELNNKQKELDANSSQQSANKANIAKTKAEINSIYAQMDTMTKEIEAKKQESIELEKKIKKKNEEISNLMRYYQVSSSGSAMLEYIMGAESLTDLIYRLSITEQITSYNKKTINEMNEIIAQNKKIQEDLLKKQEEMKVLQANLAVSLSKLTDNQEYLDEEGKTIAVAISDMKSTLSNLKKLGCNTNETQTSCYNRLYAGNFLPSGTAFYRPLVKGSISSLYGYRESFGRFHYGTDFSAATGTNVYAVAAGRVGKVKGNVDSCGNQVFIWHNINGQNYTSWYCHLSAITVSEGQWVTKDTIIGRSGATGGNYAPHLHLAMATGLYYKEYYAYTGSNSFASHSFPAPNVIIFPAMGTWWYNR